MADHRFAEDDEFQATCLACGGSDNTPYRLPTDCPGVPLTRDQELRVSYGDLDFREGQWVDLRPPLSAEDLLGLFERQYEFTDAYRVVRLDHLNDDPAKLGLTVWRPDVTTAPTKVLDVSLLADGYDFMVVREVPEEGLAMPVVVAAHHVNPFLVQFAIRHGLQEIELHEILGSDNSIHVQTSLVPVTVFDVAKSEAPGGGSATMTNLRKCECGAAPERHASGPKETIGCWHYVSCPVCGATIRGRLTEAEAAEDWNAGKTIDEAAATRPPLQTEFQRQMTS